LSAAVRGINLVPIGAKLRKDCACKDRAVGVLAAGGRSVTCGKPDPCSVEEKLHLPQRHLKPSLYTGVMRGSSRPKPLHASLQPGRTMTRKNCSTFAQSAVRLDSAPWLSSGSESIA
jgi:hypothetical protein